LREVDLIAAEDTRTSRRLLDHYGIRTPMLSCHEHNESGISPKLINRLLAGENIALIADAGTPLISDPGFRLLRELRRHGIRITPVPGPCSPIAALSACGLPTDCFTFSGFMPRSGKARRRRLEDIAAAAGTWIFLESPRRLPATLDDLIECCGPGRPACVAREMTKLHETFIFGKLGEVRNSLAETTVRGEIVVIVGPADRKNDISDQAIILKLTQAEKKGLSAAACARQVARSLHVPRSRVYSLLLQIRSLPNL